MSMSMELIAPCGINCAVCSAFLRMKNRCSGCLAKEGSKVSHCASCGIRYCVEHDKVQFVYCHECPQFPCARLKHLDKRYTGKYHASPIKNLRLISNSGIEALLEAERAKWVCAGCGAVLCMHKAACLVCGKVYDMD